MRNYTLRNYRPPVRRRPTKMQSELKTAALVLLLAALPWGFSVLFYYCF